MLRLPVGLKALVLGGQKDERTDVGAVQCAAEARTVLERIGVNEVRDIRQRIVRVDNEVKIWRALVTNVLEVVGSRLIELVVNRPTHVGVLGTPQPARALLVLRHNEMPRWLYKTKNKMRERMILQVKLLPGHLAPASHGICAACCILNNQIVADKNQ